MRSDKAANKIDAERNTESADNAIDNHTYI